MLRVGGEPRKTAPTHPPSAGVSFNRTPVRDASAIPSDWVGVLGGWLATTHLWGCCTVGTLRRYHGLWEDKCLAYGCRTIPLGTLCDTMRWVCWMFVGRPGWVAGGRDAIGDTKGASAEAEAQKDRPGAGRAMVREGEDSSVWGLCRVDS